MEETGLDSAKAMQVRLVSRRGGGRVRRSDVLGRRRCRPSRTPSTRRRRPRGKGASPRCPRDWRPPDRPTARRELELAAVEVAKEDVDLIVKELEVPKEVADRELRVQKGCVQAALRALINA